MRFVLRVRQLCRYAVVAYSYPVYLIRYSLREHILTHTEEYGQPVDLPQTSEISDFSGKASVFWNATFWFLLRVQLSYSLELS